MENLLKAIHAEFGYIRSATVYYSSDFDTLVDKFDDKGHTELMEMTANAFDFDRDMDHYEHFVTLSNYNTESTKVRMIYTCHKHNILYPRITLYAYGNTFEETNAMMNKLIDIVSQYKKEDKHE